MEDEEAEDVQEMCTSPQKEQKYKLVQTGMKLACVRAGAGQRSFRMGRRENVPGRLVLFIMYL